MHWPVQGGPENSTFLPPGFISFPYGPDQVLFLRQTSTYSWKGSAPNQSLLFPRIDWKVSSIKHFPLPPSWNLWHMCLPSPGSTPNQVPEVGRRTSPLYPIVSLDLYVVSAMLPPVTILPWGEDLSPGADHAALRWCLLKALAWLPGQWSLTLPQADCNLLLWPLLFCHDLTKLSVSLPLSNKCILLD